MDTTELVQQIAKAVKAARDEYRVYLNLEGKMFVDRLTDEQSSIARRMFAKRVVPVLETAFAEHLAENGAEPTANPFGLLDRLNNERPEGAPHGICSTSKSAGSIVDFHNNNLTYYNLSSHPKTAVAALRLLLGSEAPEPEPSTPDVAECECCQPGSSAWSVKVSGVPEMGGGTFMLLPSHAVSRDSIDSALDDIDEAESVLEGSRGKRGEKEFFTTGTQIQSAKSLCRRLQARLKRWKEGGL